MFSYFMFDVNKVSFAASHAHLWALHWSAGHARHIRHTRHARHAHWALLSVGC